MSLRCSTSPSSPDYSHFVCCHSCSPPYHRVQVVRSRGDWSKARRVSGDISALKSCSGAFRVLFECYNSEQWARCITPEQQRGARGFNNQPASTCNPRTGHKGREMEGEGTREEYEGSKRVKTPYQHFSPCPVLLYSLQWQI